MRPLGNIKKIMFHSVETITKQAIWIVIKIIGKMQNSAKFCYNIKMLLLQMSKGYRSLMTFFVPLSVITVTLIQTDPEPKN